MKDRLRAAVARRYVAGPTLGDALAVDDALRARGLATTVGYWNAAGDDPDAVVAECEAAARALAGRTGGELSLKLPALPRLPVTDVPLHLDALAPEHADRTLATAVAERLGVTLPGRWRRSVDDAAAAVEAGLRVRVVKGQWADPGDPRRDPGAGFLAVIDRLAEGATFVAVATHDAPLAREALARLETSGVPCERQLLFGIRPGPPLPGVPVRVYIPYGTGFLPYRDARRVVGDMLLARREWIRG